MLLKSKRRRGSALVKLKFDRTRRYFTISPFLKGGLRFTRYSSNILFSNVNFSWFQGIINAIYNCNGIHHQTLMRTTAFTESKYRDIVYIHQLLFEEPDL